MFVDGSGDERKVAAVRLPLGPSHHVTLVHPYYENGQTLRRQIARWSAYPVDLRNHLTFVIVDDGSPEQPAAAVVREKAPPLDLRVFRVEVDVRWNQHAARNIGMNHARDGWCLMTDMDHTLPLETAHAVVHARLDPGVVYRFCREDGTGAAINPHPNSWLMTRGMFWRTGGYDEALSGIYGTDRDFRFRVAATAPVHTLAARLVRSEHDGDSSTRRYSRNEPEDRAAFLRIVAARPAGWRPKTLSFPYHEVPLQGPGR